ncbi:hypothetical protein [Marinobacter zhanjiangensis]|uniref:Sulfotransferase family protein n=1 Tax=Marinobacter zhanjiangensis TaxID=578215 RepID=A0ABQ3B5E6_9GAMM|nr:hypothetical protein [Marinobacter zhanjiangensis]GGY76327.1 hypothetical protein GCM10007071_24710 [Marinobacter zhanjiangensis]
MKNKGVFAVVGMPYSGSTLLSFIVGSNPKVYNGADLHYLNPRKRGMCSLHKESCDVLTQEALEDIYSCYHDCDEWYDSISNAVERPYIFDASKQLSFFQQVLPKTNKPMVVIALSKHPMRAISSDLFNRLFDRQLKIKNLSDIKLYINENEQEVRGFIEKRIDAILQDVEDRRNLLDDISTKSNILKIIDVKYEDYIEVPDQVIPSVMEPFGLDYDDSFLDYRKFNHHPITGNMAPIWKVKGEGKKVATDGKNFRKDFYMKNDSSIVVDNKYKELLSERNVRWIESLPRYRKLIKILDYQPMLSEGVWQKLRDFLVKG